VCKGKREGQGNAISWRVMETVEEQELTQYSVQVRPETEGDEPADE